MKFIERILNAIAEQTEQGSELFEKKDVAALKRLLERSKQNPLVRFFNEEEVAAGLQGDHDNLTPEECAIRLIRGLRHEVGRLSRTARLGRARKYTAFTREGKRVTVTVPED